MIWAVTGTREGGTPYQIASVSWLWSRYGITELHDGAAIGVDEQLYYLARAFGARVILHPPVNPKFRAKMLSNRDDWRPERGYHARDEDMVNESQALVSVQLKAWEPNHGGTRYTTDYARSLKRPLAIVWPNGHISYENWDIAMPDDN